MYCNPRATTKKKLHNKIQSSPTDKLKCNTIKYIFLKKERGNGGTNIERPNRKQTI